MNKLISMALFLFSIAAVGQKSIIAFEGRTPDGWYSLGELEIK
jgi:hypothetical protein